MSKKIRFQFRGGLVKQAAYDCGPDGAITLQPDYSLRAEPSHKSARKHRYNPLYTRRSANESRATPSSQGSHSGDLSRHGNLNEPLSEADNQFLESLGLLSLSEEPTRGSTRSRDTPSPQPHVATPTEPAHSQHQSRPRSPFSLDVNLFSKLSIGPSRSRAPSPEGHSSDGNRADAAAREGTASGRNARAHTKGLSPSNYIPFLPIMIDGPTRDPRRRPDAKPRTARDIFNKLKGGLKSSLRALSPGPQSPTLVPTRPNTPPPQYLLAPTSLPGPDDALPSWVPLSVEKSREDVLEIDEDDEEAADADAEREDDADVEADVDEQDGGAITEDTKETGDADVDVDDEDEDEEDELEEVEIAVANWTLPRPPTPGPSAHTQSSELQDSPPDAPSFSKPSLVSTKPSTYITEDDVFATEPNSPTLAPQPLVDPEAFNDAAETLIREAIEQVDRQSYIGSAVEPQSSQEIGPLPGFEELEATQDVERSPGGTVEIAILAPTPPPERDPATKRSPTPTTDPSLLAPTPVRSRAIPKTPSVLLTPPTHTTPLVAPFNQATIEFGAATYRNESAFSSNVSPLQAKNAPSQRTQVAHIDSNMQVEQVPSLAPFVPMNSPAMNVPILTYPVPSFHPSILPVSHPSNDIPEVEMSAPDVDVDMQVECSTTSTPSQGSSPLAMFLDRPRVPSHWRSRCVVFKRFIAVTPKPAITGRPRRSTFSVKARLPQRQQQSERCLTYRCRRRLARYTRRLRQAGRPRAMSLDAQYQYDQDDDVVMDGGVVNFEATVASDTSVAKPMNYTEDISDEDVEILDATVKPQRAIELDATSFANGSSPSWTEHPESILVAKDSTASVDVGLTTASPSTVPNLLLPVSPAHCLAQATAIPASNPGLRPSPALQVSTQLGSAATEDEVLEAGPSEPTDPVDVASPERPAFKGKAKLIDISTAQEDSVADKDVPSSGSAVGVFDEFTFSQWGDAIDPAADRVSWLFHEIITDMKSEGISSEEHPAYINRRLSAIVDETRSLKDLQDEFLAYQVWAAEDNDQRQSELDGQSLTLWNAAEASSSRVTLEDLDPATFATRDSSLERSRSSVGNLQPATTCSGLDLLASAAATCESMTPCPLETLAEPRWDSTPQLEASLPIEFPQNQEDLISLPTTMAVEGLLALSGAQSRDPPLVDFDHLAAAQQNVSTTEDNTEEMRRSFVKLFDMEAFDRFAEEILGSDDLVFCKTDAGQDAKAKATDIPHIECKALESLAEETEPLSSQDEQEMAQPKSRAPPAPEAPPSEDPCEINHNVGEAVPSRNTASRVDPARKPDKEATKRPLGGASATPTRETSNSDRPSGSRVTIPSGSVSSSPSSPPRSVRSALLLRGAPVCVSRYILVGQSTPRPRPIPRPYEKSPRAQRRSLTRLACEKRKDMLKDLPPALLEEVVMSSSHSSDSPESDSGPSSGEKSSPEQGRPPLLSATLQPAKTAEPAHPAQDSAESPRGSGRDDATRPKSTIGGKPALENAAPRVDYMKFVRGHLLSSRPLLSAHTAAVPETRESSKKGKKSKKSKKSKDLPTGEADPASAEPSRGAKPKRDKKSRRTKGKEPSQVKAASKADQNACVDSEDPSPAPYTVRRSTPLPKSAGSHEEKLDDSLTEYHNSSDEKLEFDPVRTWIECSLLCILYWSASWLIRTVISSF